MSITLDSTLQTALDGINRRPIVEIISQPSKSVIPVQGNYYNTESTPEGLPDTIITSTGRIVSPFIKDDDLYLYYSNTDRTQWYISTTLYTAGDITSVSSCELTNGNIGLILSTYSSPNYKLKYMIISPTGTVVTSATEIMSTTNWIDHPDVITLANDTYLLVYPEGTKVPPDTTGAYYLYSRTSSDFTSWGSASSITLTGLDSTHYKDNPDLVQLSGGRVFLHFNYMTNIVNLVEIHNVYSMYSDNNGSSWSTVSIRTGYTELGTSGVDPSASVQADDDITLVYSEVRTVRRLDSTMDGYPVGKGFSGTGIVFNQEDNELYVFSQSPYYHNFEAVVTIDAETWEYDRLYDTTTSPKYLVTPQQNSFFESDGEFSVEYGYAQIIYVTNHELETITAYTHLGQNGYDKNWDYPHTVHSFGTTKYCKPKKACVQYVDGIPRLYILMYETHWAEYVGIGWIDLTEQPDAITGLYTWNDIYSDFSPSVTCPWNDLHTAFHGFGYIPEQDWVYYTTCDRAANATGGGGIVILDANEGYEIAAYSNQYDPNFPYGGALEMVYVVDTVLMDPTGQYEQWIYFTFDYHSSEPDKRGLARIRMYDRTIEYFEPTWVSTTDYKLQGLDLMYDESNPNRILMTCNLTDGNGGVVIFDTKTAEWTIFNNDTVPGFLPSGTSGGGWGKTLTPVTYDPVTKTIYAAYQGDAESWTGILAFSEYGAYSTLQYADIQDADTTPVYGSYSEMSFFNFEYEPSIAYDENDILWLVWKHLDETEESLVWSNLIADKNLESFISKNDLVKAKWDIEGINKLEFVLSHGHLFDPQHLLSIYSVFLKKGRSITLRIGELISDTEYWQKQGTFFVKESLITYGTNKYPKINVKCEDMRTLWEENEVVASTYYNNELPATIIEDIVYSHADLEATEYSIPSTFSGEHGIYHQFVDMTIEEMIKEILDHFMYYSFVNVDGKFEPRHLDLNRAVDHTYPDSTHIIEFTPDDSYSSFTNRIVVEGMSNVYSEILYEEESVGETSGTVGWWGGEENITVWYSKDHTRTVRYPRLEVIQSVGDFEIFGIKAGGGTEYVSEVDEDETYVVITIERPDLVAALLAAVAALLLLGEEAIGCDDGIGGWCGVMIFGCTIVLNIIMMILGAIANYSYVVWGRPIGHEKRTFQGEANDEDFQETLNGKIVTERIEDPFCYSVQSCRIVAQNELSVVMAQRNRIKFKKLSHLQDEIGDVIQINHPYSGEIIKTFVTTIERAIKVGQETTDTIEGWRLT